VHGGRLEVASRLVIVISFSGSVGGEEGGNDCADDDSGDNSSGDTSSDGSCVEGGKEAGDIVSLADAAEIDQAAHDLFLADAWREALDVANVKAAEGHVAARLVDHAGDSAIHAADRGIARVHGAEARLAARVDRAVLHQKLVGSRTDQKAGSDVGGAADVIGAVAGLARRIVTAVSVREGGAQHASGFATLVRNHNVGAWVRIHAAAHGQRADTHLTGGRHVALAKVWNAHASHALIRCANVVLWRAAQLLNTQRLAIKANGCLLHQTGSAVHHLRTGAIVVARGGKTQVASAWAAGGRAARALWRRETRVDASSANGAGVTRVGRARIGVVAQAHQSLGHRHAPSGGHAHIVHANVVRVAADRRDHITRRSHRIATERVAKVARTHGLGAVVAVPNRVGRHVRFARLPSSGIAHNAGTLCSRVEAHTRRAKIVERRTRIALALARKRLIVGQNTRSIVWRANAKLAECRRTNDIVKSTTISRFITNRALTKAWGLRTNNVALFEKLYIFFFKKKKKKKKTDLFTNSRQYVASIQRARSVGLTKGRLCINACACNTSVRCARILIVTQCLNGGCVLRSDSATALGSAK
jgi:hypothetical protein